MRFFLQLAHRLTKRGIWFICAGLAICTVGIIASHRDLFTVGALLFFLTIAAVMIASVPVTGLRHRRHVSTHQASLGQRLDVRLEVEGSRRTAGHLLHFEEVVPLYSGIRPRFAKASFGKPWTLTIDYHVTAAIRGRHQLGPILVRSFDPFGLARQDLAFTQTDELAVAPRIWDLDKTRSASSGHSTDSTHTASGSIGSDDILIREYQRGDDKRRIHWRSTARLGQLHVRREEQAWRQGARIFLDNRLAAHAGIGPASSFEWAVSMCASIGTYLMEAGAETSVYDSEGIVFHCAGRESHSVFIDAMIDEQFTNRTDVKPGIHTLMQAGRADTVYAILGGLTMEELAELLDVPPACARAYAVIVDTASFAQASEHLSSQMTPKDSAELLAHHGWNVTIASATLTPADAWIDLTTKAAR